MAYFDDQETLNVLAQNPKLCTDWRAFCLELKFDSDTILELERKRAHFSQDIITKIVGDWKSVYSKKCQEILEISNGGMKAIKLMNIISFMSRDNISVEFLLKVFENMEHESSLSLNREALQILQDHSMVEVQQKKSLSVYRLVQEVTRFKLKDESAWIGTLYPLLQVVQEMMENDEVQSNQLIHVQRIWKHATENAELVEKHLEFPFWIVKRLGDSGKYREMFHFSCQALSILESTLGENHRSTLNIKSWKGSALEELGEYVKALELLTEVYEKQKKLFGEEDDDCLATANDIGLVHWRLENYDTALEWFRNALEKRERIFGEEHSKTLSLKNNMALVLDDQGKYEEAMELSQQALEVEERVRGKEHPVTLTTKHNIAALKFSQGEYSDALKIFLEVLQGQEKVLYVNHPDTLTTKGWIADTYECLGRTDEAIELWKEVLEKREEMLGPEHSDTFLTKQKLAAVVSKKDMK